MARWSRGQLYGTARRGPGDGLRVASLNQKEVRSETSQMLGVEARVCLEWAQADGGHEDKLQRQSRAMRCLRAMLQGIAAMTARETGGKST